MTDIVETEPGVYSVLIDGASFEVRLSGDEIRVNGYAVPLELADPRKWNRSGSTSDTQGRASLVAPMPGKVIRLLVAVGDEIRSGEGVMVIEAMKMQNEVRAPRAGRVVTLNAAENDNVNAGAVLAVIE